jgi:hypothetical protein
MGQHNRRCLNRRWAGRDGKYARDMRDWRERRDLKFEVQGSKLRKPRTSDLEPRTIIFFACLARRALLDDPLDLTPRRGLVYDAAPVSRFTVGLAKEEVTWQVMR